MMRIVIIYRPIKLNMKQMTLNNSVKGMAAVAVSLVALSMAPVVKADSPYSPYNIYVGSPVATISRQISVNKQVKNPTNGQFVDNLNASTYRFLNNQEVIYRINVTNSGQTDLSGVSVTDALPAEVNYVSSPASYDQNTRRVNFTIPTLVAGQTYTLEYKAKVVASTNKGGVEQAACPVNTVEVRVNDLYAKDQAMICVGGEVLGEVQELPITGPKETMMILGGSAILMGMSVYLFRKSSGRTN